MKTAVVIGASSGIGAEIAKRLQDKNALKTGGIDELWLIARRAELLEKTAADAAGSARVRTFPGDVTDKAFLDEIAAGLKEENAEIGWLVFSAGTGTAGRFEEQDVEGAIECLDVNCRSLTTALGVFAPFLSKGARVVVLASGAAFFPQPGFAVYAASKSYALSLSRSLGMELAGDGVSVTAVCPGPCDTEFLVKANKGKPLPKVKRLFMTTPEKVAKRSVNAAIKRRKVYCPTFGMKAARALRHMVPDGAAMEFFASASGDGKE